MKNQKQMPSLEPDPFELFTPSDSLTDKQKSIEFNLDDFDIDNLFRDCCTVATGTLNIEPPRTTSQGKRAVRTGRGVRFFRSSEHQRDIDRLTAALREYAPAVAAAGPLGLSLVYVYSFNASEKAATKKRGHAWHDTRPDCDNIAKVFIDVLADLKFMSNDSQIVQLRVEKQRQSAPRILFNLYRITD
jgi:Holliday junction resolvase RusA-like endonuclease